MAFCLDRDRPVEEEVRRLARAQFMRAVAALLDAGAAPDQAKHRARRAIKKVQALVHLVDVRLSGRARSTRRHLRFVSRWLAALADAEAVVQTHHRLEERHRGGPSAEVFAALGGELLAHEARIRRRLNGRRVSEAAARLLNADAARTHLWSIGKTGVRAVLPGFARSVRRGRRAMIRARVRPTMKNYHRWRQCAKEQWLQVRLLRERCNGRLLDYEAQLGQLDGLLGEHNNGALLADFVRLEAPLSRPDVARYLRCLRQYQRELRTEANALGQTVHGPGPRAMTRLIRRYWRLTRRCTGPAGRGPWPRAA